MNEVSIPLKIQGIAQIKAELRELKGELANATDPEQVARLSQQAGILSDKIKDANDQVKVFASGSKFEQVSNGLGGIGDSLRSLDFAEASDKAKVFSTTLGSLNPKDLKKGFSDFTSMLGTLSKAFIKLGVTILMNPIFLIVAAVAAIIAVVALVLKSFGVLDDVIDALMAPIRAIIQAFKDMTDWLGLSANAAEDNAARSEEANKKVSESSKARETQVVGDLEREINEAKAAGEETLMLELKVKDEKIREAEIRKKAAKKDLEDKRELQRNGYAVDLKAVKDQMAAETEIIKQAYSDKTVLMTNHSIKKRDDQKKDDDEQSAKQKAINDKYAAADKASLDQITAARKIVTDSTKTAQQKEVDDLNAAYDKKIKDATKYKNDTKALTEAQAIEVAAINKKYADAAQAKKDADDKAANEKRIAYQDAAFLEMQRLTLSETDFKILQATQAAEAKMNQFTNDADMVKLLETELAANIVQIKKDAKDKEVEDAKKAQDEKDKITEEGRQKELKGINDSLQMSTDALNTINSLASIGLDAKLRNVKKGSKEEEKLLRQQFRQQKAMQLAMAAINGAQAILAIMTVPDFTLGVASGLRIAASVAATAASIATISATQFNAPAPLPNTDTGGGGGSTTAVGPSGPQLFGAANTGNNITAGGGSTNMTVTAVVSETEITATQHHINNIQNNSKL